MDTFINAIYLYDDKVLITFNYKEGTQTMTFGEATEVASEGNGSDLDCFTAPRNAQAQCAWAFLFLCDREDPNSTALRSGASNPFYPLRFFCQMRYRPSVIRVSR